METFSALLAICAGNSPVPSEFPTQRPVTRSFDVFFDLRQNKRLSKQSWDWWFETLSRPLWRHRNDYSSWPCPSRFELETTPRWWGYSWSVLKHRGILAFWRGASRKRLRTCKMYSFKIPTLCKIVSFNVWLRYFKVTLAKYEHHLKYAW